MSATRTNAPRRLISGSPSGRLRQQALAWTGPAALVLAVGVGVMAFFLSIYPANELMVPMGWDTSKYLWRTELMQEVGIANMEDAVPSYLSTDPARPATPVVLSTFSSLWAAHPFRVASVLPSVSAAALALAAGAFVGGGLRRPWWDVVAVVVGVGTSAFMVRLLGPESYQDNLLAGAVFLAASLAAFGALENRSRLIPAALLFGAGGVVHWAFFVFMVGTAALAALAYLPGSWRRWRGGESLVDTPSGRLGLVAGGGAAVAAGVIYGLIGSGIRSSRVSGGQFDSKLRADLPRYRLPIVSPLAVMGAVALGNARSQDRGDPDGPRFTLVWLIAWTGVAVAGVLGFVLLGLSIPAHRFLAYALAIPILAILGVLWVGRAVGRRWPVVGTALVVVLLTVSAASSAVRWFRIHPWIEPVRTQQAATAAAYLDAAGVDPQRPVVFLIRDRDASFAGLMTNMIRSVLPADRIRSAYFYAGSPRFYLAREPTPDETGQPGGLSARYLAQMKEAYAGDPVALILKFYDQVHYTGWVAEHPDSEVGPGVAVVQGPRPPGPVWAQGPVGPYRSLTLAALAIGTLAGLLLIGLGWTAATFGHALRPLEVLATAPAVGIAALVLAGVLVDRAGIRMEGMAGALTTVGVAIAGWGVFALVRRLGPSRRAGSVPPR